MAKITVLTTPFKLSCVLCPGMTSLYLPVFVPRKASRKGTDVYNTRDHIVSRSQHVYSVK